MPFVAIINTICGLHFDEKDSNVSLHSGDKVLYSDTSKCVEVFFGDSVISVMILIFRKIKSSAHFKVPGLHSVFTKLVY